MPPLSALPPPCPLPCPSSFFSVSKGASQNLKPVPLGGRAHYSRGIGSQPASRPSPKPEDSGATGCCPAAHAHLAQQGQQPGLAGRQGCACHPWPFAKTPKTPVSGSLLAPLEFPLTYTHTANPHAHAPRETWDLPQPPSSRVERPHHATVLAQGKPRSLFGPPGPGSPR